MREVAERRQQLELEHEQALAILKFKQNEIKRLQRNHCPAKSCPLSPLPLTQDPLPSQILSSLPPASDTRPTARPNPVLSLPCL
uniref:Uncharacterized protein n=1 Tax=Oncorhynchus kisutch TaxID=8019 RepID=A0A8C7MNY7_ONCKI